MYLYLKMNKRKYIYTNPFDKQMSNNHLVKLWTKKFSNTNNITGTTLQPHFCSSPQNMVEKSHWTQKWELKNSNTILLQIPVKSNIQGITIFYMYKSNTWVQTSIFASKSIANWSCSTISILCLLFIAACLTWFDWICHLPCFLLSALL